jgi:hypothetical protein
MLAAEAVSIGRAKVADPRRRELAMRRTVNVVDNLRGRHCRNEEFSNSKQILAILREQGLANMWCSRKVVLR